MRRGAMWLLVGAMLLGLCYGVAGLYRLRIGRGDVFPEYSSLRADPLGVRALHDAAGLLPGREAVRWLKPLDRLEAGAGDVVMVVGLDETWGSHLHDEEWNALDRAAVAGAHVVVAWRAQEAGGGDAARARALKESPWEVAPVAKKKEKQTEKSETVEKAENTEETEPAENAEKAEPAEQAPKAEKKKAKNEEEKENEKKKKWERLRRYAGDNERRWGYRVGRRDLIVRVDDEDAFRGEAAPADWPEALVRWRSDLFFVTRPGDGWRVLFRRGTEPVMIERKRGAGSVTLLADSFILSNEAVQRERATPVLAALLGDARRVVFVESHLGVKLDSGVAVLARRYGLGGAAFTALVLAGLWIWRRASPLAPILPEDEEVRLVLAPTAGLEALLRRAVAPAKLYATCVEAWKSHASEGDRRRLEAAPPTNAPSNPVAAYNATAKTLSHKRLT